VTGADTFAQRVRKARVYAGLSQVRCAKHLGCSPKTIWNWENGFVTQPDVGLFHEFAQLTGVSIAWLYDAAPTPPPARSFEEEESPGPGVPPLS
jgi:transcriptional regulator with XRE-family HTH domain